MALRYWVGGTANWDGTAGTKWALTSGGAGGQAVPTSADDVFFDVLSGAVTVTLTSAATVGTINFTGFPGTFTFSANLSSGNTTLGSSTTYTVTGGNPTTYTFTTRNVNSTFTANGKILPTNLNLGLNATTVTFAGNADFGGNLSTSATGHTIKAATGTTIDLRIGGNISFSATTVDITEYVTIKAYGVSKTYNSNSVCGNIRVVFVAGSVYSSNGNAGLTGASLLTVETGGRFNALSGNTFSNGGTTTLSGFNASNNSDFYGTSGGVIFNCLTDIVIKSFIRITASGTTINCSGASKVLLEGDLTSTGGATTVIDRLEFSGTTLSTVSAVTTSSNLFIRDLSFNKTGAGSVNFTSTEFRLVIPAAGIYTWTHTSGAITYSPSSVVRIEYGGTTSTLVYSESISLSTPSTINSLLLTVGILQLNSPLRATTLTLTGAGITFTGTAGWTCGTWLYSAGGLNGFITLQSGITYTTTTNVVMLGTNANRITMRSNAPTVSYAIWTLQNPAAQSMIYVNAQGIDSNAGMTIYSFGGTILTSLPALNWFNGAAQGTKTFTFVN